MTHPSVCLSLPLPFSLVLSNLCLPLKFKLCKTTVSLTLSLHTLLLSLNLLPSLPVVLCIADVVPLLVLTSENPRKNLAIIQWCSQLKREWLNPLFLCVFTFAGMQLLSVQLSTTSLPVWLFLKAESKQWETQEHVTDWCTYMGFWSMKIENENTECLPQFPDSTCTNLWNLQLCIESSSTVINAAFTHTLLGMNLETCSVLKRWMVPLTKIRFKLAMVHLQCESTFWIFRTNDGMLRQH